MTIHSEHYRVHEADEVDLRKRPTREKPVCKSSKAYAKELSDLQQLLYASNSHALLVVFQAMDAAGKDGAIRHVMSGINPQGCQVFSFKHPSATELQHDFLWRTTRDLPERGRIGIFNRSYYEEVLIVRVHRSLLRGEGLADEPADDEIFWNERFRSMVDLERHLHANGTRIVKIFLHLSKEEQRLRFLDRIDAPYMAAYEQCLSATSTQASPWYIVPADDKDSARLIVSRIVLDALRELKMAYPVMSSERKRELRTIRKTLVT
jgi:polyphosphate kinase 2 (PPK2 family)